MPLRDIHRKEGKLTAAIIACMLVIAIRARFHIDSDTDNEETQDNEQLRENQWKITKNFGKNSKSKEKLKNNEEKPIKNSGKLKKTKEKLRKNYKKLGKPTNNSENSGKTIEKLGKTKDRGDSGWRQPLDDNSRKARWVLYRSPRLQLAEWQRDQSNLSLGWLGNQKVRLKRLVQAWDLKSACRL